MAEKTPALAPSLHEFLDALKDKPSAKGYLATLRGIRCTLQKIQDIPLLQADRADCSMRGLEGEVETADCLLEPIFWMNEKEQSEAYSKMMHIVVSIRTLVGSIFGLETICQLERHLGLESDKIEAEDPAELLKVDRRVLDAAINIVSGRTA